MARSDFLIFTPEGVWLTKSFRSITNISCFMSSSAYADEQLTINYIIEHRIEHFMTEKKYLNNKFYIAKENGTCTM